jgi:hypothetical protein
MLLIPISLFCIYYEHVIVFNLYVLFVFSLFLLGFILLLIGVSKGNYLPPMLGD